MVGFLGGFWRGFDGFEAVSANHRGILRLEEDLRKGIEIFCSRCKSDELTREIGNGQRDN
jgi:hypothetical protein